MANHISGQPVTVEGINEKSAGLLRNSIDERIVKIRPMSTPLDQLSRCAGSRHAGSMTVEYYSVDTKPTETAVKLRRAAGKGSKYSPDLFTFNFYLDDPNIIDESETVLMPDVTNAAGEPLVFYCTGKTESGAVNLAPVNLPFDNKTEGPDLQDIEKGTRVVRMGRAASELDVQTAQFSAIPEKESNNCQIFKMQVEQSTFAKIADKEIGWDFSDQEEAAIIDMRLGMEKSFIFGCRTKIFDSRKKEIRLSGWTSAAEVFPANVLRSIIRRQGNMFMAATADAPVAVMNGDGRTVFAYPSSGQVESVKCAADTGPSSYVLDESALSLLDNIKI